MHFKIILASFMSYFGFVYYNVSILFKNKRSCCYYCCYHIVFFIIIIIILYTVSFLEIWRKLFIGWALAEIIKIHTERTKSVLQVFVILYVKIAQELMEIEAWLLLIYLTWFQDDIRSIVAHYRVERFEKGN